MNRKELVEIAKKKGLKGYARMTVKQLEAFAEGKPIPEKKKFDTNKKIIVDLALMMVKKGYKFVRDYEGEAMCQECGKKPIYNITVLECDGIEYEIGSICMWKPIAIQYLGITDITNVSDNYVITSAKYIWMSERDQLPIVPFSPSKKYPHVQDYPTTKALSVKIRDMWVSAVKRKAKDMLSMFLRNKGITEKDLTDNEIKSLLTYFNKTIAKQKMTDGQSKTVKQIESRIANVSKYKNMSKEEMVKEFNKWLKKEGIDDVFEDLPSEQKNQLTQLFSGTIKGSYDLKYNGLRYVKEYKRWLIENGVDTSKRINDGFKTSFLTSLYKQKTSHGRTFTDKQNKKLKEIVDEINTGKSGNRPTQTKIKINEDTKNKFKGKEVLEWVISRNTKLRQSKGEIFTVSNVKSETDKAVLTDIISSNNQKTYDVWIPKERGFKKEK